jgi:hypothetical protein
MLEKLDRFLCAILQAPRYLLNMFYVWGKNLINDWSEPVVVTLIQTMPSGNLLPCLR